LVPVSVVVPAPACRSEHRAANYLAERTHATIDRQLSTRTTAASRCTHFPVVPPLPIVAFPP
jgi:hypothetical protein